MVEFILLFFVVYLALGMMVALFYQWFVRRNIMQRVREAGGELVQMRRMEGQPAPIRTTKRRPQPLGGHGRTYYVVKYRTSVGNEMTRMCKLTPFGGVFWYDEE